MIKHHPTNQLLTQYCAGNLSASLSVAVSIHVDMCPLCQEKVAHYEQQHAEHAFMHRQSDSLEDVSSNPEQAEEDFDSMLFNTIVSNDEVDEVYEIEPVTVCVKNTEYTLPRTLTRIGHSKFSSLGKLARSRVDIDDGELRSSLFHIDAGGEIPEHTHTGFELTLLLDGEFSDEAGSYVPGDFIWQDQQHQHTPVTKDGCLCYTVVSSALHFNKGLSKLLNPIGQFIY
ncbi:ChrR family anti-sigma-E factor [Pseudoalteromonas sp. MMG010]|uniref:ChrR family anti-sigma-E factor n=1 Tax=Pseudoalteromonas sp. MMG010 TaxID=2822685 RepID=UPI001B3A09F8|nr:ChrR family anti-sigma-E factor [Pseudoalteromonas sp. MMG010]MBQ4833429.1 ChrR family anti-sigma-E factor [Pseudoalteromonas sp. MMG010]